MSSPRVIYEAGDLRVVLRDTKSYPEGYVEIERRGRDAIGATIWLHTDGLSLDYNRQVGHAAVLLFIHLMRERCPELKEPRS